MGLNLTEEYIHPIKYCGQNGGNFTYIRSEAVEAGNSKERAISGDLGPGLFLNSKNDDEASVYLRVYMTGKVQFGVVESNGDSTDFTYYGHNYFARQGSSPYLVGVSFSQKIAGEERNISITGMKQGSKFIARPTINVSGINQEGKYIISTPEDVVDYTILSGNGNNKDQVDYNAACEVALNNLCSYLAQQEYIKGFIKQVIAFSDNKTGGEITGNEDPFFQREKSFAEALRLLNTEYDVDYTQPLNDCLLRSLGLAMINAQGNLFPGEAKEYGYPGRVR